ncbi:MAG: hypothetical protein LBK69_05330 [Syntrophomonadaceae bacterium]|jgi:hypothetical protein|nr:hypothetical protein [Syntrophomonadaceae bacterium]
MSVKAKENPCAVTTTVSGKEKGLLVETARDLDVPYYTVMRRLVRYILDGKIDWMELFKQSNELSGADGPGEDDRKFIRTQLNPELSSAFAQLAEDWGSTTGIVLRRLMLLYIFGKIPREAIWY